MKTFKIDGKEFNQSTSWDEITLRQYIENVECQMALFVNQSSYIDAYPEILAILLRPATAITDPITGIITYERQKYDRSTLQWRIDKFMDGLYVPQFISLFTFFLSGI